MAPVAPGNYKASASFSIFMYKLFKSSKRVEAEGENVFIDNSLRILNKAAEIEPVIRLTEAPEIRVYENGKLIRCYHIASLKTNPNLTGQYLHSSIRILENSAVMIDGIISKSATSFPELTDAGYEAIRLQPFFLSNAESKNIQLKGKGLFDRGLHFSGTMTPATVRCICVCDNCQGSFTLQHFHAGMSEVQYFYSDASRETLIVPYSAIVNMPRQLQEIVDLPGLLDVEGKLPKSLDGNFRYYNSFNCPHCLTPFIDFEQYKSIRPKEYYGNTLINHKPRNWASENGS